MGIDKKTFMLCESTRENEIDNLRGEWKAQIKFDGERVISVVLNGEAFMFNRRGKIVNFHFKEVERELSKLKNCIIDGEIISKNGNFNMLQKRALTTNIAKQEALLKSIPCKYMLFDILREGSIDLREKPLRDRHEKLNSLFELMSYDKEILQIAEYKPIKELLEIAKKENYEGIVIKNMMSYYEGRRSNSWLKLKLWKEQILTIISYMRNPMGYRCEDKDGNAVQIAGKQSREVIQILEQKGQVSIIVQYLTISKDGRMRFPSYRGLVV